MREMFLVAIKKGKTTSASLSLTRNTKSKRLLLIEHLVILGRRGNPHALSPDQEWNKEKTDKKGDDGAYDKYVGQSHGLHPGVNCKWNHNGHGVAYESDTGESFAHHLEELSVRCVGS